MSEPLGPIRLITLHWTAGRHDQVFHDYHFCITGDGGCRATLPLTVKGAHTWRRNSGNIGVALCAMADGHPVTQHPVTQHQRETAAAVVAELCHVHHLPLRGVVALPRLHLVGGQLVEAGGVIEAPTVADHAWFAKRDGYYPDRWDIGEEYLPLLSKAAWYLEQLRLGKRQVEHTRRRG